MRQTLDSCLGRVVFFSELIASYNFIWQQQTNRALFEILLHDKGSVELLSTYRMAQTHE